MVDNPGARAASDGGSRLGGGEQLNRRALGRFLVFLFVGGFASSCGGSYVDGGDASGGTGAVTGGRTGTGGVTGTAAGGSVGLGGTGGTTGTLTTCGFNPAPGDACAQLGTCAEDRNCFCVGGAVSCAYAGTGGVPNAGTGGATGVDCGPFPMDGNPCIGIGVCANAMCVCFNGVVTCASTGGTGGSPPVVINCWPGGICSGGPGVCPGFAGCFCVESGIVVGNNCPLVPTGVAGAAGMGGAAGAWSVGGFGGAPPAPQCPARPVQGDPCVGPDGQCSTNPTCFCQGGTVWGSNWPI